MQQTYKTTDLAPDERIALERLLGRELQNDEAVEVIARKVARETDRRKAVARIRELAKRKTLGGSTVDDLIDEGRRL